MTLVCDAGPLIALAKIRKLSLIPALGWQTVLIPPIVHKELCGKIGPESPAIESALATFVRVRVPRLDVCTGQVIAATAGLDEGEKQVTALGVSIEEEAVLLLDDKAARRAAKRLGISVVGTAGLLLAAKRRGLIDEVLPLVQQIRQEGYWLSDALIAHVGRLAGEELV